MGLVETILSIIPYGKEIYNSSTKETWNREYDYTNDKTYKDYKNREPDLEAGLYEPENKTYTSLYGTIAYPSTFSRYI